MAILSWDPFREMTSLQSRVTGSPTRSGRGAQSWVPAVDVFDSAEAVVLKAELPGMKIADIQIEVDDNVLTIKGERGFDHKLDDDATTASSGTTARSSAAWPCRRASRPTASTPSTRTASSR